MRGAPAKVLTAAPNLTARRERHERRLKPQPARYSIERAQPTMTGAQPTATLMVRAQPREAALRHTTQPLIARGKSEKERMAFCTSPYNDSGNGAATKRR